MSAAPSRARGWVPPVEPVQNGDVDLLAAVLGSPADRDARGRALALLEASGGVHGLLWSSPGQLVSAGLEPGQLAGLRAAIQLGLRIVAGPAPAGPLDRASLVALLRPVFLPLAHEEIQVVCLAGDGAFLQRQRVAQGGGSMCAVHPRDVLARVIESRASRFVVAHNHPSGRCAPSPEDVAFSERLQAMGRVLGVALVDHLVFARDGVSSAMPEGALWPALRRPRDA